MTSLLHPHFDILPASQKKLWPQLKPGVDLELTLYGGTAIALQLGHRSSIDFDFFSDKKLDRELLRGKFLFFEKATLLQDQEESLTILTAPLPGSLPVKISFFGNLSFGRVGEPRLTNDGNVQLASLEDLMATKLKVIFQRVESKDYIDIAAMIEAGVSLPHGLAAAATMFGSAFQPSECLKAITYFHGGDLDLLTKETKKLLIAAATAVEDLPAVPLRSSRLIPSLV
jgi:hypothetical protein